MDQYNRHGMIMQRLKKNLTRRNDRSVCRSFGYDLISQKMVFRIQHHKDHLLLIAVPEIFHIICGNRIRLMKMKRFLCFFLGEPSGQFQNTLNLNGFDLSYAVNLHQFRKGQSMKAQNPVSTAGKVQNVFCQLQRRHPSGACPQDHA